jgi:DNA-binding NarL/FixJ family response regulator
VPEQRRGDRVNVVFTPAQIRILDELIRDGATNTQIADRLGLTVNTVKCQLWRAMHATGCTDRAQLAVRLLRGDIAYDVSDRRYAA